MAAASQDLCTLAQVRELLQKATSVTGQDDEIQSVITRVSDAIMEYTGREFVTLFGTASGSPSSYNGTGTRTFVHRGGPVFTLPRRIDLRSVSAITFDTDGSSPANLALTTDDYRLVVDTADRVWSSGAETLIYSQVEFRGWQPAASSSSANWRPSRQFSITGVYGWPSIPGEVRQAAIDTTIHVLRHKGSFYSAAFNDELDMDAREGRYLFPFSARQALDTYMRRAA